MTTPLRRARRIMRAEYPVRVYQWIVINLAILVIIFGAVYGVVVYAGDQAEDSRRSAEQAAYENSRDERIRCEQRVESRDQVRGAFTQVYDLIDELTPDNEFTEVARHKLDTTYPPLSLDECPPIPVPPQR